MAALPLIVPQAASTVRERFEELYAAEYPALARYCWALVRDQQAAEDIAAEAFIVLLGRLVRVTEPKAYLYRVASNLARAHWKKTNRDRDRVEKVGAVMLAASAPDELEASRLRSVVLALPSKYRDVVLLHYYSGLSVQEMASALRRPEGTIKRLLHEARGRLADHLEAR